MNEDKGHFMYCAECGKPLMKRLRNGLYVFKFGQVKGDDGTVLRHSVVDITICGSVKMNCIKDKCKHENILPFFPFQEGSNQLALKDKEIEL